MSVPELVEALVAGDREKCVRAVEKVLQESEDYELILRSLAEGMDIVGRKYESGEYFIPEMLRSARAANAVMEKLRASMNGRGERVKAGTIVIGTVSGDIHDVGKNLLVTFLRASGYTVHDLGVDVPAERFVQEVEEKKADFLLMSALTTATRYAMQDVIRLLEERGLRDRVRVLVGGVSVNERFARELGADGYAKDVRSTISLLRKFSE